MAQIKQVTEAERQHRERVAFIKENVRVYESPGHLDKYTAIFMHKPNFSTKTFTCLAMSEDPFDKAGYGQHATVKYNREGNNAHLGYRITYDRLPEPCQRLLKSSLFGEG
jgi:hypothetical protein